MKEHPRIIASPYTKFIHTVIKVLMENSVQNVTMLYIYADNRSKSAIALSQIATDEKRESIHKSGVHSSSSGHFSGSKSKTSRARYNQSTSGLHDRFPRHARNCSLRPWAKLKVTKIDRLPSACDSPVTLEPCIILHAPWEALKFNCSD